MPCFPSILQPPCCVFLLGAMAACGGPSSAAPGVSTPEELTRRAGQALGSGGFCPRPERPATEPDLFGWDPGSRGKIHSIAAQGLPVVEFSQTGCDVFIRVLPFCSAKKSKFVRSAYGETKRIGAGSEGELYARFPVGVASLRGKVGHGRSVLAEYRIDEVQRVDKNDPLALADLDGAENCAGATHVVGAIYRGAFKVAAGETANVEAGGSFLGAGAGVEARSGVEIVDQGDKNIPLRIELMAIKGVVPAAAELSLAEPPRAAATASSSGTFRAIGLVWEKEPDATNRTWADAKAYCAKLGPAGGAWRLPTRDELKALYDSDAPGARHDSDWYWSSSVDASDPSLAWSVFFGGGNVFPGDLGHPYRVRCVR